MSDLSEYVSGVRKLVQDFYASQSREVPFHGWHHVKFVAERSYEFAEELGADPSIVAIAAYVHDVNYLLAPRSSARKGVELRRRILIEAGLAPAIVQEIEDIVVSAETHSRNSDISTEAMALSDADTLFKALPITPIKLAPLYMYETGRSLRELATKIVSEQTPLRDQGIYFYSDSAKQRYQAWAEVNLQLWTFMLEAIEEPSIATLVNEVDDYAKKMGLL